MPIRSAFLLIVLLINLAVPAAADDATAITPNVLNLVVGDKHAIQAVSQSGQPVAGLTWTSSDPNIAKLSADDPPTLSAIAAGQATVTAGTLSAQVTVYVGALPVGTVVWSNPGNGTGVSYFHPAIPSPTGVADVFSFQYDGTVQAVPDFQGGLVLANFVAGEYPRLASIVTLDGMTGLPYPAYAPSSPMRLSSRRTSSFIPTERYSLC